jgi:hypothetical protein
MIWEPSGQWIEQLYEHWGKTMALSIDERPRGSARPTRKWHCRCTGPNGLDKNHSFGGCAPNRRPLQPQEEPAYLRQWLEKHLRVAQVFIPVRACSGSTSKKRGGNCSEARPNVRRELRRGGGDRAVVYEGRHKTAQPSGETVGVGVVHRSPDGIPLYTVIEECSNRTMDQRHSPILLRLGHTSRLGGRRPRRSRTRLSDLLVLLDSATAHAYGAAAYERDATGEKTRGRRRARCSGHRSGRRDG